MCNINTVYKKTKEANTNFIQATSFYSFLNNNDAYGYFTNNGQMMRSDKALTLPSSDTYEWLVTHQRLTTSGQDIKFAHPHTRKDFILVHNGVFTGLGNASYSDTAVFCDRLQESIDGTGNFLKSLQRVCSRNSGYSIMVYDKVGNELYYVKDNTRGMHIVENKDFYYYSTSYDNAMYCMYEHRDAKMYIPEDYTIIRVRDFTEMGKVSKPQTKTVATSGYHQQGWYQTPRTTYSTPNVVEAKSKSEYDIRYRLTAKQRAITLDEDSSGLGTLGQCYDYLVDTQLYSFKDAHDEIVEIVEAELSAQAQQEFYSEIPLVGEWD